MPERASTQASMRRHALHLADVLRMTAQLPRKEWADAADALGYVWTRAPSKPSKRMDEPAPPPEPLDPPSAPEAALQAPADPPAAPLYWRIRADVNNPQAKTATPAWLVQAKARPVPEGCFESDAVHCLPRPAPLAPPARLARLLRQQLARPRPGPDPDLRWLVQRLARCEPVTTLRRQTRLRWVLRVQLVVQSDPALGPLERDLDAMARQLRQLLGSRLRVFDCPGDPRQMFAPWPEPVLCKPDGAPLLVLGDAGHYGRDPGIRRAWQQWARRAERAGSRPLLLAPLPRRLLDAGTAAAFDVVLLDESPRLRLVSRAYAGHGKAQDAAQRPAGVTVPPAPLQALQGLLAGLSGVEPALLRLARRALRGEGLAGADVGTEAELMQLPHMAWDDPYCRVRPGHEGAALDGLCGTFADAAVMRLLSRMNGWAQALSPLLQAGRQQTLQRCLPAHLGPALPDEQARRKTTLLWERMAAALDGTRHPNRQGLASYMGWLGDTHPLLIGEGSDAQKTAWVLAQPGGLDVKQANIPEGIRLEEFAWLMHRNKGPAQALVLEAPGRTARLWVVPEASAGQVPLLRGLPGVPHFDIAVVPPGDTPHEAAQFIPRHERAGRSFECDGEAHRHWRIHIGERSIDIEAFTQPTWADAVYREGEDWFAILPDGRRLRWVPRVAFTVLPPASGNTSTFELPHGTWWDDAEYQGFAGSARQLRCPAWANAGHGVDGFGYWAAFSVGGVQQTMRFVPPGQFTMGSPADEPEPGRFEDEKQHTVLLTRGFWIADTACTQALWQAVTGNNPSHFEGDGELPVEQVSWDDIQNVFLPALEATAPGLALRLPSEAEWEYAARCAGHATKSFAWGEGISTEQANYDGNHPLPDGTEGEYRERTMPVKSFEPSALGLWQVHGNVYEWVQDAMAEYPDAEVVDPAGAAEPEAAARRVVRGGSWFDYARYCRSAYRDAHHPGLRPHSMGLRLARGALPEAGWAEPTGRPAGLGEPEARRTGGGAPVPAAR